MSPLADLPLIASGKVREMYALGPGEDGSPRLLMVASDRISTYDAVHPTPIPDKGKVLAGLSVFWFEKTSHIVANHLLSATEDVPESERGRALVVRELRMLPVECVVRGYITGSGWKDYQATGASRGSSCPRACASPSSCPSRSSRPAQRPPRATTRRSTSTAPPSSWATAQLMRRVADVAVELYSFAADHARAGG